MWVDEENNQDPYGRTTPAASSPSVGAGGGVASAPTGTSGTTSNPSTQTPTQTNAPTQTFGTVQDYLKGNQQQGEALGQQFTGNLANSATNEKSAIDTAAKQTQSDITAGSTNYDSGLVNSAVSDPTKVAGNPDQLSSFLKQWNASYSGPSSFENSANYAPASAAAAEAQSLGTQESTTGGQQQILHDQFGVYGQGNQGLDQAVLQNSSYFPKVQQQASDFQTIPTYLSSAATPIDTAATTAAANTANAKTQTQNAFANVPATFQAQVNNQVQNRQDAANALATKYKTDLASGNVGQIVQDIQSANPGASTQTIQSYLNGLKADTGVIPDLSQQYTFNPNTAITAANSVNPGMYANAAAYNKLTGVDYSGILNPANASQAGTAPTAQSGLNPNALQTYLKGNLATSDKALLANPDITTISKNLGIPDVVNGDMSNVAAGKQSAQALIDAAQRTGFSRQPGQATPLDNAYHQAAAALVHTAGGGALNTNNPKTAGLLQFVRQLGTFLYGAPQY